MSCAKNYTDRLRPIPHRPLHLRPAARAGPRPLEPPLKAPSHLTHSEVP